MNDETPRVREIRRNIMLLDQARLQARTAAQLAQYIKGAREVKKEGGWFTFTKWFSHTSSDQPVSVTGIEKDVLIKALQVVEKQASELAAEYEEKVEEL